MHKTITAAMLVAFGTSVVAQAPIAAPPERPIYESAMRLVHEAALEQSQQRMVRKRKYPYIAGGLVLTAWGLWGLAETRASPETKECRVALYAREECEPSSIGKHAYLWLSVGGAVMTALGLWGEEVPGNFSRTLGIAPTAGGAKFGAEFSF